MGLNLPAKSDIKAWGFPGDDKSFNCPLCGRDCGAVLHNVLQEYRISGHTVNDSLPEEQRIFWELSNFIPLFDDGYAEVVNREAMAGWCVGSRQKLDFTIESLQAAASESRRKVLAEIISDLEGIACS